MAKKIKIIREKEPEFKEVEVEELEEQIEPEEQEEFENFTEFSSEETDTVSPVLEITGETQDLEDGLANIPATPGRAGEGRETGDREGTTYAINMPDYSASYEQADYGEERGERRFEISEAPVLPDRGKDVLDLRPIQQQEIENLDEEARERETRRYHELRRLTGEEATREIPFSRRERRKERILK